MKMIKKIGIYLLIFAKIIIIFAGLATLLYSLFSKTPIRSLVDLDWWLAFFVFDLWLNNFTTVKLMKEKE